MSHNTKQIGFTLVELLISVSIMGIIGMVLASSLYSVLIMRSKQQSIEKTGTNARQIFGIISSAIETASSSPTFASGILQIQGNPCRSIRLNGTTLEQAIDSTVGCVPPTSGFSTFSATNVTITTFSVSVSTIVSATMSGSYTDTFGSHPFQYQTSILPRVTL